MKPCKSAMCPLNFSKGHYYGNGGLTSAVPLLSTPTFVPTLSDTLKFSYPSVFSLIKPLEIYYPSGNPPLV
jgi:hypothetical protein